MKIKEGETRTVKSDPQAGNGHELPGPQSNDTRDDDVANGLDSVIRRCLLFLQKQKIT
jgi:hypothetical protein